VSAGVAAGSDGRGPWAAGRGSRPEGRAVGRGALDKPRTLKGDAEKIKGMVGKLQALKGDVA